MRAIRKALFFILSVAVTAALLSGFCFANADNSESQISEAIYEVSGVDEFLASIGSDRTIILTGRDYSLSSAADFGSASAQGCYRWNEVYDGFELEIDDVRNMTIISECGSEITVEPRYAAVLRFCNCEGISISGVTAGHTNEPGYCDAGVVVFDRCKDCRINSCSLYGCGSIGVYAYDCQNIKLTDSEIYSCRIYAIALDRCKSVDIDSCRFHDFIDAERIFSMSSCRGIEIKRCEISSSSVYSLLSSGYSYEVYFTGNSVTDCSFRAPVFDLEREIIVDACEFADCGQVFWYSGEVRAVDGNGKQLRKADFADMSLGEPLEPVQVPVVSPAQTAPDGCYYASDVDEFLAAIGPNRTIILTSDMYDLSTASQYGAGSSEYYHWLEDYDGPGLIIENADNLTIKSSDADAHSHCISSVPRYANVIEFYNCSGLNVEGITFGHTQEPGYCSGGVIRLEGCSNCEFFNCRMYGCGILGIDAYECSRLSVEHCDIFDCSQGGVSLYSCSNTRFNNCSYDDLGGPAFNLTDCEDTFIENAAVSNGFFNVNDKGPITLGY